MIAVDAIRAGTGRRTGARFSGQNASAPSLRPCRHVRGAYAPRRANASSPPDLRPLRGLRRRGRASRRPASSGASGDAASRGAAPPCSGPGDRQAPLRLAVAALGDARHHHLAGVRGAGSCAVPACDPARARSCAAKSAVGEVRSRAGMLGQRALGLCSNKGDGASGYLAGRDERDEPATTMHVEQRACRWGRALVTPRLRSRGGVAQLARARVS